jgi:hypothetical protein
MPSSLRICLTLAAIACILRPTNLLIWLSLVLFMLGNFASSGTSSSTKRSQFGDVVIFALEAGLCG